MAPVIAVATPSPQRALFQNGQYVDVTSDPRPQNRNPTGVSFSDCEQDLKVTFPVVLSGFSGDSGFEVWAGTTDCTQNTARGLGQVATCWRVGPQATAIVATASTMVSVDVFARDILRYEDRMPPNPATYDAAFHDSAQGESACHVQPSDAAVTFNLYFLPVDVSTDTGMVVGTPYQYSLVTDLVGPPPPTNLQLSPGAGLLDAIWSSPGNDPDVAGFAFWTDPPPAAGAPSAVEDGGIDASADAGSASCTSAELTGRTIATGPGGSGISLIPAVNAAGEVDDPKATSFELTGLTGGARYAVSITSVDGTGNYGPPARLACATTSADAPDASSGDQRLVAGCACTLVRSKSSGRAAAAVTTGVVIVVLRRRRRRSSRST